MMSFLVASPLVMANQLPVSLLPVLQKTSMLCLGALSDVHVLMKTGYQLRERQTHTDQCCQQGACSVSSGIAYSAWPAQPLTGYSAHRAWNQTASCS